MLRAMPENIVTRRSFLKEAGVIAAPLVLAFQTPPPVRWQQPKQPTNSKSFVLAATLMIRSRAAPAL